MAGLFTPGPALLPSPLCVSCLIVERPKVFSEMSEEPFPKWPALHHSNSKVDFNDLETLKKATAQQVRQPCRDNLGRHEVARKVHLITQLPKTAAGKVLKRELRKSSEYDPGIYSRRA